MEHQARVTVIEGIRATLIKFNAKGLQIEKVKEFFAPDAMELRLRTLGEGRMNFCNLGTDDGRHIRHFQLITPVVMSNRSMIGCFYPVEDRSDGSFTFIVSMKGNENLVEEY